MQGQGDQKDPQEMSKWERATYDYARRFVLSRRRVIQIGATAAAMSLSSSLLAACGDDNAVSDTDVETDDEQEEDPDVSDDADDAGESDDEIGDESDEADDAEAEEGGSLRIARGQESDTLDPQKTALLVAHEITWQIFDSLIYLDADGTVYPGLATEWEFSDENTTVTFYLREGVQFHDGTEFTAEIVKQSVERQQDPETASPNAWMLGPLESVEVIDPLTVAYQYSEPFVPLWVGLGYSYCAPISIPAAEELGDEFGRNPVGTGPYRFVEWTADQTIKLEKNADHDWATPMYETDSGPRIDEVEFVVIPEDATRVSALISGEIDVIAGTDAVPIDKLGALESEPGINVIQRPAVGVYYANLHTQKGPLSDVRVRQAINYAVDKEKIVALVLDGYGSPATSIVASAFGDYNPDVMKYDYDLERAQELMAEAGQEAGFELDYLIIQSPFFRRAAEIVQEDLAQINVTVNINALPVAEMIAAAPEDEPEMAFFYYTYSDPDIVYPLVRSGEVFSWSYQDDPELDEWLEQQRVEFDPEARREILHQIQAKCAEQAYHLYLWEGVYAVAARDYVENIHIDAVGFIHLQELHRTS